MTRRTAPIEPEYFDALYAADPDPWRFASSGYEREKYAGTLAALPDQRFERGLEVGSSIGVLTAQLARRCVQLLAIDVAEAALAQARARCPTVEFRRCQIPHEWPDGRFDVIVFSEVLYYLDRSGIEQSAAHARASLTPGGSVLLVHFLGLTDYPVSGDEAAEIFIAASGFRPALQQRAELYRLDLLGGTCPSCWQQPC